MQRFEDQRCTLLVSRSRALRCATELERVLSSMEATSTIEAARVIGISELGKAGVAKRTANLVNHVIANCRVTAERRKWIHPCAA